MFEHVQILGTYSTSFTYGKVHNGYITGHNVDILWLVSTYVSVIMFVCSKIGIYLVTEGMPDTLVNFVQK